MTRIERLIFLFGLVQFSCMTKLRLTGLLSSLYHVYAYITRMILESEWRSDASLLLNSLIAPV